MLEKAWRLLERHIVSVAPGGSQSRKKYPLLKVTETFGDLSRYEIVSAALRVTGKSDFLKFYYCKNLKESGLGLNL